MKKKRILAMLLAGTMVLGSLIGCGSEKQAADDSSEASKTEEASSAEETAKDEAKTEEEETVTVKWLAYAEPQEDQDHVMEELNKLLKEKINVQLEFEAVSPGEFDTRAQTTITSGEDYDIIWTSGWCNNFYANVAREAYMSLNDLLETEAGQIVKNSMPEWVYSAVTVNDNIYAIPCYQIMGSAIGAYIQQDVADEYGLDIDSIKSIYDLEPFMEWIVENHPDMIPLAEEGSTGSMLSGAIQWEELHTMRGAYSPDDPMDILLYSEDEYMKQQYQKMNEYYHRGFLRQDLITVMDATPEVAANKYVIFPQKYKPGGDIEFSNSRGEYYYMVQFGDLCIGSMDSAATTLAINVNSEKGEAAMKLLSLLYTDKEVYNMLVHGIEGEHYNKTGENSIEPIADSGYSLNGQGWALGNQMLSYVLPGQPEDIWEMTEEMNANAQTDKHMGFTFDNTPVESEIAQIAAVKNEYEKGLIVSDDFEAAWEEYCKAREAAGEAAYAEEYERQLAEFYNK